MLIAIIINYPDIRETLLSFADTQLQPKRSSYKLIKSTLIKFLFVSARNKSSQSLFLWESDKHGKKDNSHRVSGSIIKVYWNKRKNK